MKNLLTALLCISVLAACAPASAEDASTMQADAPIATPEPTSAQQATGIPILPAVVDAISEAMAGRFVVPDDGHVYMQVKHDFETGVWDNQPRAFSINGWKAENNPLGGFPDTFPCLTVGGDRERVRLTEPFQRLWFDLLREASENTIPDEILLERWAEITEHGRALTDFFAVQQGYRDYILQLNLEARDIQQKTLTMGGNIVRIIGSNESHWYIEAINASQPAPDAKDIIDMPWLVHWGTQSTIEKLEDGSYLVTDWGQLNYGENHYGVPFMLISPDGRLQIRKEFLKPIENGAEYSPYSPPKD